MSYDTLCLERRRPLVDIRHDCYCCVKLDRIYRNWVCFPPVGNREVSAECDITTTHPPSHYGVLVRWRCGQGGAVHVLWHCLPFHCVCISLRPCSSLETGDRLILASFQKFLGTQTLTCWGAPGSSPYLPTLHSESSP